MITTENGKILKTVIEKKYYDTSFVESITKNNRTTQIEHNLNTSKRMIISPEGRKVSFLYNQDTLLLTEISVPGNLNIQYDYYNNGRLKTIQQGERFTIYDYHNNGFLKSTTDSENRTTLYEYDEIGRVEKVVRSDNSIIQFDYGQYGNLIIINPNGI